MKLFSLWTNTTPWIKATSGFLLSLGLLFILALFGWMLTPLIALALLPIAIGATAAAVQLVHKRDWLRLGLIGALMLIPLFTLWGETPSIFTGRDQGSIATAAWGLAKTGELSSRSLVSDAFFTIYGPGTALNFPGFAYTTTGSLITQFPLGYTAWLAGFVGWLGLSGFHVANGLLFILAGWSFFELATLFVRRPLALIGTAFFSATFLPVWMLHHTLSEHLALALFLILGLSLVQLFKNVTPSTYWLTLGAASLLLFTRIEGIAFFVITALLILLAKPIRQYALEQSTWRLIVPGILLVFLGLRDFFVNLPFYTMIGKVVIKKWHELFLFGIENAASSQSESLFHVFTLYGLAPWFLLGTLGILIAFWERERLFLVFLALALPTFVYLIDAQITPDHPWMLRRYFFTLWPMFILATLLVWQRLEKQFPTLRTPITTLLIVVILFLSQVPASRVAWSMDEHTALFQTTSALAERLSGRDLILIDRLSSGHPHALVAGPLSSLYDKQAVYFFNPEDLKRLDLTPFERIFLLTNSIQAEALKQKTGVTLIEREAFMSPIERVMGNAGEIAPTTQLIKTRSILYEMVTP